MQAPARAASLSHGRGRRGGSRRVCPIDSVKNAESATPCSRRACASARGGSSSGSSVN